jgi:hypothetical protein
LFHLLAPGLSVAFTCINKRRDGYFVLGGHGDAVAFLDNHRFPEKKKDIESIGEQVILTISSNLVRTEVGEVKDGILGSSHGMCSIRGWGLLP